jgi:Cytochrome c554 and c-prime/AhpC/TSA family
VIIALLWLWLVATTSAEPSVADPRGWTAGTPAADAAQVIAGKPPLTLEFPPQVVARMSGPTVLFYFSPSCPHCRKVAAEIERLHVVLGERKLGAVLGVVAGSAEPAELNEFQLTFATTFPLYLDEDRSVQNAMGARSTPSVMVVVPRGKTKVEARDAWLPFQAGWSALVLGRLAGNPFAAYAPGTYLGNNACAACHSQEHGSWLTTLHSIAWRTLVLDGKERDGKCTGCHVTGAGAPSGWNGEADSPLVDVGCEACHGPGGPHDGEVQDPAGSCATCHDPQHAIAFSYDRALPLIDHYRYNALSSAEFDGLRRALYNGEVPQALIALPEGRNVGSQACRSCHPAEYDWWADDPHASAMSTLEPAKRADPSCLHCHATAKVAGPPPTSAEGYERMGGVGCESCHGPGEAHVGAKGGTSNIVGLGESCPVCVIDAVCTSCHTPAWSPSWDLEPALRQVKHRAGPR